MPSFLVIFHCGIPWHSFQHMLKTSWQAPETPQRGGGPGVHLLRLKGGLRRTGQRGFGSRQALGPRTLGTQRCPRSRDSCWLPAGKEGRRMSSHQVEWLHLEWCECLQPIASPQVDALPSWPGTVGPRLDGSETCNRRTMQPAVHSEEGNTSQSSVPATPTENVAR